MSLLRPEPGLVIWEAVAFFGLLLVLWRFAWGPLLGILNKREETIRESLEASENTRMEAQKLLEDYQKQLAEARQEAQKIIEQGRKFGESLKQDITEKAKKQAEEIIAKATSEIARQKEAAINELKAKFVDLSIGAASKVLGASIDKKAHEKLVEDYLSNVESFYEN